jgi:hypothetical protein
MEIYRMNRPCFIPAIAAVLNELDYQDYLWGDRRPPSESGSGAFDRSLDEYTLYINRYAQRLAADNCASTDDFERKLHTVRKIAALAVACLHQHGPISREYEEREKYDGDNNQ